MFDTSVAPFLIYDEPEVSLGQQIEWISDSSADGIEIAIFEDTSVENIAEKTAECDVDVASIVGFEAQPLADPAMTDPEQHDEVVTEIERRIEQARKLDCSNIVLLVGENQSHLSRDVQHDSIVNVLTDVSEKLLCGDLTLLIEPLNTAIDHEGYYLTSSQQGFKLVEEVGSPAVRLLYDVYHQQVTEGNIIETISENIEKIGHVHVADVPGRHEPGTGELHYRNIFQALNEAEYSGYVGFEYFPSGDPDDCLASALDLAQSI